MTASIPIFSPMVRVLDASGDPVASGTVEFYSAGTSTPKTVYADADLTIELGTTVSTDAGGYPVTSGNARTLVYTGTSAFKMIVKDSAGATLVTHDNVPGAVVVPDAETSALSETPIVSKTTNYTVVAGDQGKLLNCNCTSGAFAITLLSAVTAGDGFEVTIRHVGTANQVTVRSSGTETISHSGKASYSVALKSYGQSLCFVSDGANWLVKASSPPRMLDGVPFFTVADRLTATPSSPTPGARYIITGSPTGAWSTLSFTSGQIAEADGNGSWFAYTPADGWTAYVEDENVITQYRDSTWTDLSNVTAPAATYLGRALFRDEKSTNTNGGTPTNTAWTKSDINTTVNNSITGLSLASSVLTFTGLTGRFLIRATKSFYATQETQIRLRDTTNNTTFGVSPQVYASSYTSGTGPASILAGASPTVFGVLNLDGTTTNVELQYYVTNNPASGLGRVRNVSGENEVYAQIEVLDLSAQQGPAGTQGTQGVDGLDAAYPYQWSTATSGDPGSGKVRGNNATIASITEIAISETDSAGGAMAGVIDTWDSGTSSVKARIKISKEGATQNFHYFYITGAGTDQGSYWTFPVAYTSTSGTISNGDNCAVLVIEKGDKGDAGAAGVTGSTVFTFSTTTTDSDPGSGVLRLNNATAASATAAYIDNNNSGASDVSAWLDSFDDTGESAFRGHLHIYDQTNPTTVFRIYKVTGSVTDGTGYRKLVLEHVTGAGSFTNGNAVIVAWLPRGATGVGDTTGAASSTDNAIVRFDGTGGKTLQNSGLTIDDSNNVSGIVNLTQTGYHDLTEISAPSNPSANVARTYAVDSQSKTVPFVKDSAGLATALDIRTGWVQMYRTSDAGADPSANPATWVVRAPDGSYVSTSGTTTQGVQEALNYIAANGYNLFINGGGGINSSDVDVATIHCTSAIEFPPMFKQAVIARGITFNFGGSATYGFKIDSMMMALIDVRSCQIVVGTSTYETGVWLRPRTANAVDPAIAITASDLLFGSIVHGKSTSVGLLIDPTEGPILDGVFVEVHEPNGKGSGGTDTAAYGVRILDHATNVVKGTTMRILDSHGHGTASVAIGSSTTNGANIHSNHFDIHCDPGASAIGLDLYGSYNSIIARINDDEGTATTGINIRSSAVYNHIIAPRIEATTKIADASAGFTNLIENEGYRYGGNLLIGTLSSVSTVSDGGGSVASRFQVHSTGADSALTTWRWSNDTAGARVVMSKSRGTAVGTQTIVQSGDVLGEMVGAGSDGTDMEPAASIRFESDGTPGAGDMPGRIVFSTTADGAEAVTERMRITSAGKVLVGTTSTNTMGNGGTINPNFLMYGAGAAASFSVIRETTPGGGGALFALGSSRSTPSTGSYSALQSGDGLASILGVGDTGTNLHATGAAVVMRADENWSGSTAGGHISLQTTPNGSLGPSTERVRIDKTGAAYFPGITTTASAANAFLDSGSTPANNLLRSTSSLRYKKDVETLDPVHAERLLQARPVWYRSTAKNDRPDWSHFGLIAEELAAIEPRLVHFAYKPEDWEEVVEGESRTHRLKDGAQKVPDGVAYDRMTVLLLSLVQKLWTRVGELEAKLEGQ